MEDRILSRLLLLFVVLEGLYGYAAQEDAGGDVDHRHAAHGDVGGCPGGIHGDYRTEEYYDRTDDVEDIQETLGGHLLAVKICQCIVHVEEVSEEGRKGKEHHGHRYKEGAEGSEHRRYGILDIGGTRHLDASFYSGGKTHQGRRCAKEERIYIDGQGLHQSLLDGVGYVGGGGGIGRRSDTCLVGIKSPLDAVHETRTRDASEDRFIIEGILENGYEHGRDILDVYE